MSRTRYRRRGRAQAAGFVLPAVARLFRPRPVLPLVKYDREFAAWQLSQPPSHRFARHFYELRKAVQ